MARDTDHCRCGHQRRAHEHLRRGTDCSACTSCLSFTKQRTLAVRSHGFGVAGLAAAPLLARSLRR